MELLAFGKDNLDNILAMEPHRMESLPFGAVLLDRDGIVKKYNSTEGMISGRSPDDVIGKNFFTHVAPCARGKRFHTEFLKFHRDGKVNTMFDYAFDYKMQETCVQIHMKSAADGNTCWLFIKRHA